MKIKIEVIENGYIVTYHNDYSTRYFEILPDALAFVDSILTHQKQLDEI